MKRKTGLIDRMKSMVMRTFDLTQHGETRLGQSMMSDSGELVSQDAVLGLSTVWACINLLAGTTGSIPCMVYRSVGDDDREVAKDHPLYRVLHDSPNYDQTAVDFWEHMAASLELRGNGRARKVKDGQGRLSALIPIPMDCSTRRLSNGKIEYRWSEDGKQFVETDENVFHIRGFGGDPLGGLSTLQYARQTFGLARAINRAASTTFQNGLRPSGVMTFEKWLTKDQRDIAQNELIEKFSGAMNAGRPMVLEGGTKWSQLSISPEDAQMLESRSFSVEELCRLFGVPPFMIGHTEKSSSWGTGLEQQTLGFVKFTLRRRLKRIEQAIAQQLLTPADRAAGITVEFNLEGLLRGDSKARSSFYQSALQNGWMTINEVRRLENLSPVEGGDVPRMQMQNIPITEAGLGHNGGPPLEAP